MGMSIDEVLEYLTDFSIYSPYQEAIDKVSVYIEQMQADYESRLKADMVAMLEEIQLEVDELEPMYMDMISPRQINEVIQQKINALRGGEDGSN